VLALQAGITISLHGGVGRARGIGRGLGVTRGLAVAVGVAVGVGVGVASDMKGATTETMTDEPVLKKPMIAWPKFGGWLESNRKLYNVPQRIALAFGFCAKVSVLQVTLLESEMTVHGSLLYPASPTVPSCGQPGCCGGAWNPTLLGIGTRNGKKIWKD
jgi:hypothetical protein